jgi:hypothetical protein
MNDEDLQKLWQNQPERRLTAAVGTDLLAKAQEQHRKFQRTIFWRDFREVGVAFGLIPFWVWGALRSHAPWTSYLMVPALLFVAGFLIVDRLRHRSDRPHPDGPVLESLRKALREVEHQIWLLRNVLWWYITPILAVLLIIDFDRFARGRDSIGEFTQDVLVTLALGAGIWWLNQYAVKRSLEPRRSELQSLLDELR